MRYTIADVIGKDGALFHDKKGNAVEAPRPLAPLVDSHGHLTSRHGIPAAIALTRAALVGVRMLVVPVDTVGDVPDKFETPEALLEWFDAEIACARELLRQAKQAGITPPEFSGWDVPELIGENTDNVWIVAGAHPYGADRFDAAALERTRVFATSKRGLGIGEFGLDFGPYNELSAEVQLECFRTQLRLAHELDLPVELHIRDGNDDTLAHDMAVALLGEEGVSQKGVDLHCFTSNSEVMKPFVDMGCHVAFGGASTFKRSVDIREAATLCPQHFILSETDAPYMTPEPLRGTTCEPALVAFTAKLLAEVREEKGVSAQEETFAAFWSNAQDLFGR